MKQVGLRVPDELYEHLCASARVHHRSLNNEILIAVEILSEGRDPKPEWEAVERYTRVEGAVV